MPTDTLIVKMRGALETFNAAATEFITLFEEMRREEKPAKHTPKYFATKMPTQDQRNQEQGVKFRVGGHRFGDPQLVDDINWLLDHAHAGTPLPEDEPIFVLRAQDKFAPRALHSYAMGLTQEGHNQQAQAAVEHLAEFDAWSGNKKVPD